MYYAQFYDRAVYPPGTTELIEACGDRGVIILDGRMSRKNMLAESERICRQRRYLAYRIYHGETFTRSQPITKLNLVEGN